MMLGFGGCRDTLRASANVAPQQTYPTRPKAWQNIAVGVNPRMRNAHKT